MMLRNKARVLLLIASAAIQMGVSAPALAQYRGVSDGVAAIDAQGAVYGSASIDCGSSQSTATARAAVARAEAIVNGELNRNRGTRTQGVNAARAIMACVENIQRTITSILNSIQIPINPLAVLDGLINNLITSLLNKACAVATNEVNSAIAGVAGQINGQIGQFNNSISGQIGQIGSQIGATGSYSGSGGTAGLGTTLLGGVATGGQAPVTLGGLVTAPAAPVAPSAPSGGVLSNLACSAFGFCGR